MKTKIVYCLVSDSTDYYYEQLLISLCSLRKHNPNARVIVVCDNQTYATLVGNRRGIYEYEIQVIPVDTPKDWGKMENSRYLKTNLRKLVQGDFLYIDVDTVICASLDFVDDFTCEVGAVYDSHIESPLPKSTHCKYESQSWIWTKAKKKGVNIEGYLHFNGGVMFVKDTPNAHELYAKWYEHYQQQLRYGVVIDQLPLLLSNREMNDVISPLDWSMNCQVPIDGIRNRVADASIIHYFPGKNTTLLSSPWILDPIKETGKINAQIQRIIDNPATFFSQKSKVVMGDAASLLDTPSLLVAYKYSHKVFTFFAVLLDAYARTKNNIYQMFKLGKLNGKYHSTHIQ